MGVHARQSSKRPHAVLTTLIQKGQLTEHGQHSLAHDENSEDFHHTGVRGQNLTHSIVSKIASLVFI
jgi:hypothetical protein